MVGPFRGVSRHRDDLPSSLLTGDRRCKARGFVVVGATGMGMKAAWRTAIGLTAAALCGGRALAACSGNVGQGGPGSSPSVQEGGSAGDASDASSVGSGDDAGGAAADSCASACADATPDAAPDATTVDAGATTDGDGADAQTDAPPDALNPHERCDVSWPQPAGLTVSSSGFQLVADPAGGAYVVVTYGEPSSLAPTSGPMPTLDVGVPTAGYQTAVAIVRLDDHCAVSWVREIGSATFSNENDISNVGAAVDTSSNLTIAGSFSGAVDLGAGIVSTPPDASSWSYETYVLRFDPDGNSLLRVVFRSDGPFGDMPLGFAASASGTSSVLVGGGTHADFGDDLDASIAPNASASVLYLVQLAAGGGVLTRTVLQTGTLSSPLQSVTQIAVDSDGTLWGAGNQTGDGSAAPGAIVMRFTSAAAVDWDQPISEYDLLAAGPGGAALLDTSGATPEVETLGAAAGDGGGPPATRTVTASLGSLSQPAHLAVDADGAVVAFGLIPGGLTELDGPEGGVYVSAGPSQVGYVALDATGARVASDVWATPDEQRFGAVGSTISVFVARLER
jgi:hypothetical protein